MRKQWRPLVPERPCVKSAQSELPSSVCAGLSAFFRTKIKGWKVKMG